MAADDLGVFRTIADRSQAGLRTCKDSARLWYLAARAAEVLDEKGLKEIVADALAHAPNSAPVLTVGARVQGSASLARKAHEVDPAYQPARRALAELLAKQGGVEEALRLTANPSSDAMRLTRARVLLAAKRPAEAVTEIRKLPKSPDSDEPSPAVEMRRDTQEVLGFALLDLHKMVEAEKALRAAAAAGSTAAQHYLAQHKK
jgi:hypothetical protein